MMVTIEDSYLEELHSIKRDLMEVYLTIGARNVKAIMASLIKARTKHPEFCSIVTDMSLYEVREALKAMRKENDLGAMTGCSTADGILMEEHLEAMEQHLLGKKDKYIEEIADGIAVQIRMMNKAMEEG